MQSFQYKDGDIVEVIRDLDQSNSTRWQLTGGFRLLANDADNSRVVAAGTRGKVLEHANKLIVTFDEPGIAGRSVDDTTAVKLVERNG